MSKIGILTHSFVDAYNGRLDRLFGGGLERYIYNLCAVIREMGAEPEVHQLSFQGAFERHVEGITGIRLSLQRHAAGPGHI